MATKTPIDPRDSLHGEEEVTPRFGPGSPGSEPSGDSSDPRGPDNVAAGKSSDPRAEGSIASREPLGGVSSRGKVDPSESALMDKLGKGFTGGAAAALSGGNPLVRAIPRLLAFFGRNKKKAAAGGGVAGIVGSMVFIFGVLQGPFEFVDIAQFFQLTHFQSNEDLGNNEGAKTLFYAITGKGAQRARLGIPGNYAADKWEAKLLKETGLKPVYSSSTRLLIGFELANANKTINTLLDVPEGSKTSRALEQAMGQGAEIVKASEVRGQDVVSGSGEKLDGNARVLNLKDVKSFRERGKFVKTVGKLSGVKDVVSTLASRLLKKRAGVDFHPLKKITRKTSEKLADWRAERRKEAAKEDREGAKSGKVGAKNTEDSDGDGKPDSASSVDTEAAGEAGQAIEEAASEPGKTAIKSVLSKAGYGGVAVGILCAAKGFGDSVPDYKYANNVLPMMRMGFRAVSMGNQVMSGEDVSIDELGAFKEALYDPDTKTHWNDARTIQGELGQKQVGPNTPPEARLTNVNDKPFFFDVLDQIPFLGTACDISGVVESIPLVGDVINLGSEAVLAGLNVAASTVGTSVDKIMEGALAMVSGQSVDTLAQGADYGNLANTGAFLAANDNAISMGGSPLTNAQRAELRTYESQNLNDENKTKSFAERYLDPYDTTSLASRIRVKVSPSTDGLASFLISSVEMFSGGFTKILPFGSTPVVSADSNVDYGVPKFGFSLADQEDPEFEDPYDNAVKVEPRLDELNDKYGKPCFGMTVTANDEGIQIDTEEMGSDDLNVFKVIEKKDCTQNSGELASDSTNSDNGFWSKLAFWRTEKAEAAPAGGGSVDPWFNRYRHYLVSSVSVASQACWEANGDPEGEKYCDMLGFANTSSPADDSGGSEEASVTVNPDDLYKSSEDIACAPGTKDLGTQDGYHEYKKIKIRVCAVQSVAETGGLSSVPNANGKLVVNSLVSAAVVKMYEDAKNAGVSPLNASEGFRTMKEQTHLYECKPGCGVGDNPVANPGTSNHQMGLALDVDGAMNSWMINNGKKYGFTWYGPGDDVHFSPDGS